MPRWATNPGSIPFCKPRVGLAACAAENVNLKIGKSLMEKPKYKTALIVGAGEGLSASLARLFAREGLRVALAARQIEKLGALCSETGARAFACNATDPDEVERLFGLVEREIATPDVVVYNASGRARGAFADLVPADVAQAFAVSAFAGLLVAQQAVKRLPPAKHAAVLFTR